MTTSTRRLRLGLAAAGLGALVLAGCSNDRIDGAPASGSVSAALSGSTSADRSSALSSSPTGSASASGTEFASLSGVATKVDLDSAFVKALTTLKVTPGLLGTAKLGGTSITFPVTGGLVRVDPDGSPPDYVTGHVDHVGSGLSLTAGSVKIELSDLVFDFQATPDVTGTVTLNGNVDGTGISLFDLDTSTVRRPTVSGGTAVVSGAKMYFSAILATALNSAFDTDVFRGDKQVLVGSVTATLTGG